MSHLLGKQSSYHMTSEASCRRCQIKAFSNEALLREALRHEALSTKALMFKALCRTFVFYQDSTASIAVVLP